MTTDPQHQPPLAERMRPRRLEQFVGQTHLVGKGQFLSTLLASPMLPSLILWGPPGCGKTTLATIMANTVQAECVFFSAILAGVKEIRNIVEQAEQRKAACGNQTILFVDEIHRFNKSQQDFFLPYVESGLLTLIGATTENPSFQIIAPLLSRCQVVQLHPLSEEEIQQVILQALNDTKQGLGGLKIQMEPQAVKHLARGADGDCRRALNILETAINLHRTTQASPTASIPLTKDTLDQALQHKTLRYDKNGEEHYNLISALHKSLRDSDPDGAVYWLNRMLEAGEEPLYIARRLIRFASEDVGNADPQAIQVAVHCREAYHILGAPEGNLALVQAAVYLATAPKSNALYMAEKHALKDIRETGSLPVPRHLCNAVTGLMRRFGYGKGYQYAHDHKDALVHQQHLPQELEGRFYYKPTNRGYESIINERLTQWRKILNKRAKSNADLT